MTPGKAGLIFGLVAAGAIVAGIATAFLISELFGDNDTNGDPGAWRTYKNEFLGFEVAYPRDWHILERGHTAPSSQPFISGGVVISEQQDAQRGPNVRVSKHFQGDFCLRGRLVDREIEVSGVKGMETRCYDCEADAPVETCPADPHTIAWIFGSVGEPDNYVVLGEAENRLDIVSTILESFRFID